MNRYQLFDTLGNEFTYDATDMRMVLHVHQQLHGTEPGVIQLLTPEQSVG